MTHWQHPGASSPTFPGNSSPPSVLAEMLTATLGAQCMLWQTSPAATEMETRVLDWLRQMVGLPEGFAGVIQDSASSATLCAILCARERATDWRRQRAGARRLPEALLLHIRRSPLLGREGRHDRGPRPAPAAPCPDRRKIRHAPRPARGRDPRRPRARPGCRPASWPVLVLPASARSILCARSPTYCRANDLYLHVEPGPSGPAARCCWKNSAG